MGSLNVRQVIEELLLPEVGIFPHGLLMARTGETTRPTARAIYN